MIIIHVSTLSKHFGNKTSESTIRPSIQLSLIVNSRSNPFLEAINTKE